MSAQTATGTTTATAAGRAPWALVLDGGERLLVLGLYGWFLMRLATSYAAGAGIGNLILMVSEGLVLVFFVIRRRTTEISRHPGEWCLALAATCLPALVAPGGDAAWMPGAAATVMLIGIFVQLHAKVTLARSLGLVPAHRGLKTSGPYRFVRHPMYAGYLLAHLGFLALNPTWWNLAVYALCYSLQVPRVFAEERFLGRDPAYREYQARVRYRIVPGVF
jgi:protein-S-isoprenylcysteine O-methyltransferase Ste14